VGKVYYAIVQMRDAFFRGLDHYYFVVAVDEARLPLVQAELRVLREINVSRLPPPPTCFVRYLEEFISWDCVKMMYTGHIRPPKRLLKEEEFRELVEEYIRACGGNAGELEKFISVARRGKPLYPLVEAKYPSLDISRLVIQKDYEAHALGPDSRTRIVLTPVGFVVHVRYIARFLLPYDVEEVDPEVVAGLDSVTKERFGEALAVAISDVRAVPGDGPYAGLKRILPVMEYTLLLTEMLR